MKAKTFNGKLVLRKQTIAALNLDEMNDIQGGICPPSTDEFLCKHLATTKSDVSIDTCGVV